MLVSFLDSIRHVGQLYPIALMRIYLGYYFLTSAFERLEGEFLTQPRLAAVIMESLPQSHLPNWYAHLLQYVVAPQWQFFAYFIMYCEFVIAISFLLGFLVRPVSLLGAVLMLNYIYAGYEVATAAQQLLFVTFILMFWVGAGRCLGIDYYFYKRQRGLWW